MSKPNNNTPNDNPTENAQAEKLYRFHPDVGFTEVAQGAQTEGNPQATAPYGNPYMQGQIPPFMPHNPYHNPYHGAGYHQGYGGHAEHIRQMEENARQHAAYMASINGNFQNSDKNEHAKNEFTQERIQEMYGTFNDVMNGKAEPTKILGLFQGISSDFWKGAALGAAAIAIYNCSPVKEMIGTSLATLLAAAGLTPQGDTCESGLDKDGFDDDGFDNLQTENMSTEANPPQTNSDAN